MISSDIIPTRRYGGQLRLLVSMKNPKRTTLLINLSVEQANQIRAAAKKQDRTISAYILRAVMSRLNIELQLADRTEGSFGERYLERRGVIR
jgi:hypothetical protein